MEQSSRTSKTGLRPCPFCGSVSLSLITFQENKPLTLECNDCGATGPTAADSLGEIDSEERIKKLRILWDSRRDAV